MKLIIRVLGIMLALHSAPLIIAQSSLLTPHQFFNVPAMPGEFTLHHEAVSYFQYIANQSSQCIIQQYGQTPERRPLIAAFISSEENLSKLDFYKRQQQIRAGQLEGDTLPTKPIIWLSYNVHGDEAAGTEAALATLHHLTTAAEVQRWLDEVIVVIDPCENPDGHDRYVHHYRQSATQLINPTANAAEHHQPWPGGRFNHYLFDLNRDWVWGTQPETQARVPFYQQYMPHVHVDLHEMGAESPYFFAPAAIPFHEVITPWQRQFQAHVGHNNAQHFDRNGWLYYTSEIYDLLYPSYGDTWPTFNGAIGFTYEQGGSGRAGRALQLKNGSTLTLYDRTQHHFTASLATIETAYNHRHKLIDAFFHYFHTPVNDRYNAYIVQESPNTRYLLQLLDRQNIKYGHPQTPRQTLSVFDYNDQQNKNITLAPSDIIIPLAQPMSRLVKVLMEPHTYVEDSLTYDLTAWSLPYVYQVPAYATTTALSIGDAYQYTPSPLPDTETRMPYAALLRYEQLDDAKALARLLHFGIQVRLISSSFSIEGQHYPSGSLLITRADNGHRFVRFDKAILEALESSPAQIQWVHTGLTETGSNLGSERYPLIPQRKIAVLYGEGASPLSYGEIWSYLEQELQYPFTPILISQLHQIDLSTFDVLIVPSGQYVLPHILDFAQQGGTVIALEEAAVQLANSSQTQIRTHTPSEYPPQRIAYSDQERHQLSFSTAGAIYKATLDATHPLAYGIGNHTYLMKRNHVAFNAQARSVWQVGTYQPNAHYSGFVGQKLKNNFDMSIAIGVEQYGSGHLIYFPDSPIFRGFWHSGKLLMSNALFFVH